MTLGIKSDFRGVFRELDRLDRVPKSALLDLEKVLAKAFLETQKDTHIITGSLLNSGTLESDVRKDVWEGSITYGGPSVGFPNNPVKYAEYEQRRDGSHDFMLAAYAADKQFGLVVAKHVKGKGK